MENNHLHLKTTIIVGEYLPANTMIVSPDLFEGLKKDRFGLTFKVDPSLKEDEWYLEKQPNTWRENLILEDD